MDKSIYICAKHFAFTGSGKETQLHHRSLQILCLPNFLLLRGFSTNSRLSFSSAFDLCGTSEAPPATWKEDQVRLYPLFAFLIPAFKHFFDLLVLYFLTPLARSSCGRTWCVPAARWLFSKGISILATEFSIPVHSTQFSIPPCSCI